MSAGIEAEHRYRSAYLRTMVVNSQAVMFGYTVSWSGVTLASMISATGACGAGRESCLMGSLMASISSLFAAWSSLVTGYLADSLGRRKVLNLNALVWILGYGTLWLAPTAEWVLAARALAGIATGTASVAVPLYVSETAPTEIRGELGGLFNVGVSLGVMAAFGLGRFSWRFMAALGTLPPALMLLVSLLAHESLLPESPRWLASRGKDVDVLGAEAKTREKVAPHGVLAATTAAASRRVAEYRALGVGIGVVACFVLTGNNAIQAYFGEIVPSSAFGGILFAATQLVCAVGMIGVIERVGRRPLLMTSAIGSCSSLAAMARCSSWWLLVSACIFIASVTIGLSTLAMPYAAEVLPDRIRSRGVAYASCAFWIGTFGLVQSFSPLCRQFSTSRALDMYAFCTALSVLFIYCCAVETKGRTFEDVTSRLQGAREEQQQQNEATEKTPLILI